MLSSIIFWLALALFVCIIVGEMFPQRNFDKSIEDFDTIPEYIKEMEKHDQKQKNRLITKIVFAALNVTAMILSIILYECGY
jgi:hypothetical protein